MTLVRALDYKHKPKVEGLVAVSKGKKMVVTVFANLLLQTLGLGKTKEREREREIERGR